MFGFYDRFWWWDTLLHTVSGFLLGIVGFIAVFVLNGTDRMPSGMRPSFVSIFGFTFAVTLGVVWEIWEFVGDLLVPSLDMQIAASGVQDTMIDLLVNTVGAAIVALVGYAYLAEGTAELGGRRGREVPASKPGAVRPLRSGRLTGSGPTTGAGS